MGLVINVNFVPGISIVDTQIWRDLGPEMINERVKRSLHFYHMLLYIFFHKYIWGYFWERPPDATIYMSLSGSPEVAFNILCPPSEGLRKYMRASQRSWSSSDPRFIPVNSLQMMAHTKDTWLYYEILFSEHGAK